MLASSWNGVITFRTTTIKYKRTFPNFDKRDLFHGFKIFKSLSIEATLSIEICLVHQLNEPFEDLNTSISNLFYKYFLYLTQNHTYKDIS